MGTCAEYGKRNGELKETFKTKPLNNYAKAKDKLKKSLFNFFKNDKTIILWGRLFYVYGKDQKSRTVYGQLSNAIKSRTKVFNMTKGDQIRDYLNVKDVSKIIYKILINSKKSEVINICSGNPISLKSHVKKWIKNKACKLKINYGFYKNSNKEIKRFWGSTKKLNKLLI